MRVNITSSLPTDWGDWLVEQQGEAAFGQSSRWFEVNEIVNIASHYWVEVFRGSDRMAGGLFSYRRSAKGLQFSLPVRSGWLSCFEGPVFSPACSSEDVCQFLSAVKSLVGKVRARGVVFSGFPAASIWGGSIEISGVFREFGYTETPYFTSLVDLSCGEMPLFDGLKRSVQKAIRRCIKDGITVTQCETFENFYSNFIVPYYEDNPDDAPTLEIMEKAWKLDREKYYHYFAAQDANEKTIATLGTYRFNGMATEIMSKRTRASFGLKAPVQDYLHWEVFKVHQSLGDTKFNLAGYSTSPETKKEEGIRNFKVKWGGEEKSIPYFTRDYSSMLERGIVKLIKASISKLS